MKHSLKATRTVIKQKVPTSLTFKRQKLTSMRHLLLVQKHKKFQITDVKRVVGLLRLRQTRSLKTVLCLQIPKKQPTNLTTLTPKFLSLLANQILSVFQKLTNFL